MCFVSLWGTLFKGFCTAVLLVIIGETAVYIICTKIWKQVENFNFPWFYIKSIKMLRYLVTLSIYPLSWVCLIQVLSFFFISSYFLQEELAWFERKKQGRKRKQRQHSETDAKVSTFQKHKYLFGVSVLLVSVAVILATYLNNIWRKNDRNFIKWNELGLYDIGILGVYLFICSYFCDWCNLSNQT